MVKMTSRLAHTQVSGMSKDMLQPCRCFSKLIGLEDTSSTGMKLFRESQICLLLYREINTNTALVGEHLTHATFCTVPHFGLGSYVVIRIQIQQLKKEN